MCCSFKAHAKMVFTLFRCRLFPTSAAPLAPCRSSFLDLASLSWSPFPLSPFSSQTFVRKITFNKKIYKDCAISKSIQLPFSNNTSYASSPIDIIHSDYWMSPIDSLSGFCFCVLFTYEFSRYSWIYPMCRKSEVSTHF